MLQVSDRQLAEKHVEKSLHERLMEEIRQPQVKLRKVGLWPKLLLCAFKKIYIYIYTILTALTQYFMMYTLKYREIIILCVIH